VCFGVVCVVSWRQQVRPNQQRVAHAFPSPPHLPTLLTPPFAPDRLTPSTHTPQDVGGDHGPHTLPVVLSKERVGSAANQTGRAILGASPSGGYVSCCWPASRRYVVFYRTLAGTWQEVDAGLGVDLAWHSHRWVAGGGGGGACFFVCLMGILLVETVGVGFVGLQGKGLGI